MKDNNCQSEIKKKLMPIQDAMDVLNGKWKIAILTVLCYHNQRRFSDILNDVSGISNKMLSKELKDLEMNKLVKRTVIDTKPVTIQYTLTGYSLKLLPIIKNLSEWGTEHRKVIIGQ